MFVKAKKILASELMYAKGMDAEEAAEWLEGVLSNVGPNGKKRTSREATAAALVRVSVWAVLAAAGSGERLESAEAFANLRDRPRSPSARAAGGVRWIVDRRRGPFRVGGRRSCSPRSSARVVACVTGGATRASRCARPSTARSPGAAVILVHDAARPLVDDDVIERVAEAAVRRVRRRGADGAAGRHGEARAQR